MSNKISVFPVLQQSAGIFSHLKGSVMAALQQDPTTDLCPDVLAALSALMLAQAQEIFVHKAIHGETLYYELHLTKENYYTKILSTT